MGFRLRARCIFSIITILLYTTTVCADAFGESPIDGPPPELDPNCTVFSIEGPEFEYWVSWDGPVVAPGIPLTVENFLNCPFGRKILHPVVCITVTMVCGGADPTTERMCFHAGSGTDGKLKVLPTDYRKPGAKKGTFTIPDLPTITPDAFREFWKWYDRARDHGFGNWDFCHAPSEDRPTHNCGSYFLLILSKLFGKTPDELRALIPPLGKCAHISYDLYPPSFFEQHLEPLLLLLGEAVPEDDFGIENHEGGSMCPAIAGVLAEQPVGEIGINTSIEPSKAK